MRRQRVVRRMADRWRRQGYAVQAVCPGYAPPEPIAGWSPDLRATGHGREIAVVLVDPQPAGVLRLARRYELSEWALAAPMRQLHWIRSPWRLLGKR